MSTISIPGLRGTITQRGKNSYRLQMSLGRNAEGKYDVKRETVRGTKQDAIDLLTKWNALYLDNALTPTNYETVRQAYEQWIAHVETYRAPNTYEFYKRRFEDDLLPELGHRRLKDITLNDMQKVLAKHPTKDRHNKKTLSAFMTWCVDNGKLKEHDCRKLKTKARPRKKQEKDVWNSEQVQKVYGVLTFDNLYDIFIVLGIECGLRPQEILGLTWDKVFKSHLIIDQAVKERTPEQYTIGSTKTDDSSRMVAVTPYLVEKLAVHRCKQKERISTTREYNTEGDLVVADGMGNVPDLNYIRRYIRIIAKRAKVQYIPPKNLRSTYISLLNALGIPLPVIQQLVGHSSPDVTTEHYIRIFDQSLKTAATLLQEHLHQNA